MVRKASSKPTILSSLPILELPDYPDCPIRDSVQAPGIPVLVRGPVLQPPYASEENHRGQAGSHPQTCPHNFAGCSLCTGSWAKLNEFRWALQNG